MYPFIILSERYDITNDVFYDSLMIISAIYRIVFRKLSFSLTPPRFLLNVTAELAEIAKDLVRAFKPVLFPITLRVLSALRGFFLINRRARRDRKGFGNSFHINALPPLPSACFASLAVLFP